MLNRINLQGGDNDLPEPFYRLLFRYIKNNDALLNLGCGTKFNFERAILKEKKGNITSIDILSVENIPTNITFLNQSVEEEFILDKKFDIVSFFELIEHIDKTDILLKNCFNNLKQGGYLIFSFPNLASVYARIELLFGFQPHILEVSNYYANFGTGKFGQYNNPRGKSIHHLRGITHRAMKEMIMYYGFTIEKIIGYDYRFKNLFAAIPSFAPINIFICKKK